MSARPVWPPTERAFARWLFDRTPALRVQRVKLCDLLQGRTFRLHAAALLENAVAFEQGSTTLLHQIYGDDPARLAAGNATRHKLVSKQIDQAAHLEWIAQRTELGEVLWGKRINRDYVSPEDDDL